MKVLIVCPYPHGKAPSQRFRFEQYLPYLRAQGLEVRIAPFWNESQWPMIYNDMGTATKVISTLLAFVKRGFLLFSLPRYDTVFIHREATPIGPPWWEWCAARLFRKRIIYDFDDAVWLPNSSAANAKLVGRLKNHSKTAKTIAWSALVFAGNGFLAAYARAHGANVKVIPTTIDTHHHQDKNQAQDQAPPVKTGGAHRAKTDALPTIGWTGTHSTLKQLVPLFGLLQKIAGQYPFRFLLIADEAPPDLPSFVEFRKWKKESEIADLREIDIGIMPLYATDWERGKCGFKALQYMALEIPAVVSGVGVNTEIVEEGLNGFICEALTDSSGLEKYALWEKRLIELLLDENLRAMLGKMGRKRVVEHYSVEVFKTQYLEAWLPPPPR